MFIILMTAALRGKFYYVCLFEFVFFMSYSWMQVKFLTQNIPSNCKPKHFFEVQNNFQ